MRFARINATSIVSRGNTVLKDVFGFAEFSSEEREAIREATRRANPDINGDLIRILTELSPSAAEKMRRIVALGEIE